MVRPVHAVDHWAMKTTMLVRLSRATTAALVALAALMALATPAVGVPRASGFGPPRALYLSLGDSLAFGFQEDRLFPLLDAGTYTPDAFNTGYTDGLAARMHHLRPDQQTVNLSCPGETTDTMINGGCSFTLPEPDGPGLALHSSYAGPQLDAAVAFLVAHPGQVSPITIAIGANDAKDVIADGCNFDPVCIDQSGLSVGLALNLDQILGALRTAAPDAQIVVLDTYNPFSRSYPGSDGLWRRHYSTVVKDAARRNGAVLADTFQAIRGPSLCQLTFACSTGDIHPTDAGYQRIADVVFDAAGYRRL
jgi:lysophospholipase L1-like esterase